MGAHHSLGGISLNIGRLLQGTEPALLTAARGVCAGADLPLTKPRFHGGPRGAAPPCPSAFPPAPSRAGQRSAGGEEGNRARRRLGGHLWPRWLLAGHVGPAPLQLLPPGPLLQGLQLGDTFRRAAWTRQGGWEESRKDFEMRDQR